MSCVSQLGMLVKLENFVYRIRWFSYNIFSLQVISFGDHLVGQAMRFTHEQPISVVQIYTDANPNVITTTIF